MQSVVEEIRSLNGTTPNPAMVRVTPEIATQWLEAMQYSHQRAVRQGHAEFLAEEMRRGKFIQGTQIRIVRFHDKQYLVDGQHRLWAVVLSGQPQSFSVLMTYASSEEEIGWIYGNLDINLRRTGNDLFGALSLPDEFGMTKTDVGNLSSAVSFLAVGCVRRRGGTSAPLHRDDVVTYMRLYAPYMRLYLAAASGCEDKIRKPSMRAATLSVALLSFRYSQPHAELYDLPSVSDFWHGALFDDGIQVGDPRKVANRHLLTSMMLGGNYNGVRGAVVPASFSARVIANCLNAYMQRRDLKMTKVLDDTAPLRLVGVPVDATLWMR